MRVLRLALIAAAAGLLSSCTVLPGLTRSNDIRVVENRVYYQGRIDDHLLQQLLKAVTPQTNELVIASMGGFITPTYRIAELLQHNKINITVTGPCVSACSILFSAGAQKTVLPGGYLGYHWNMQSNPEITAQSRVYQREIDARVEREVEAAFNKTVGVQQALYDDAWLMVNAYNQRTAQRLPWLGHKLRDFTIWLPTPTELACYGLHADKFWYPAGGDLTQIPSQNRTGGDLIFFTSKMLPSVPAGVSTCVERN